MPTYYVVHSEPRYVQTASGKTEIKYLYEFLVVNAAAVANLPGDAYPGSRAYTADRAYDGMLDVDGETWVNSVLVEKYHSGEVYSGEV